MICRPLPSHVSDWIAHRVRLPRSSGWHVSTVLTAMLQAMGTGKYATWGQRTPEEARKPTDELGYLWEDVLTGPLAARALVPEGWITLPAVELCVDGIYGTPDRPLFDTVRRRIVIEEIKATYMNAKGVVDDALQPTEAFLHDKKFTYWRMQVKTYAAMVQAMEDLPLYWFDDIREAIDTHTQAGPPLGRLRALFLNGRYSGELALPAGWELEWTAAELSDWWGNVVAFARQHPDLQSAGE